MHAHVARELLAQRVDGRVGAHGRVERVDAFLGGCTGMSRRARERRGEGCDTERGHDTSAVPACTARAGVNHEAGVEAVVGAAFDHDDFATASLLCRGAEKDDATGEVKVLEGPRRGNSARAASDGDEVVPARVPEALERVHLAVEADGRDYLDVRSG